MQPENALAVAGPAELAEAQRRLPLMIAAEGALRDQVQARMGELRRLYATRIS